MKINTGYAKYCNEGLKPEDLTKFYGGVPEISSKTTVTRGLPQVIDHLEQSKALMALAAEAIEGFVPFLNGGQRPPPDKESSKAYWSIYTQGNAPEPGGKMELYDCDFKAVDKGAKPEVIVECNRPVQPALFVDNRQGLVFGVIERRGLQFNVVFLGFAPVCEKAGNFRTCVHEIA